MGEGALELLIDSVRCGSFRIAITPGVYAIRGPDADYRVKMLEIRVSGK
jgi:hypothetical protein